METNKIKEDESQYIFNLPSHDVTAGHEDEIYRGLSDEEKDAVEARLLWDYYSNETLVTNRSFWQKIFRGLKNKGGDHV